MRTSTRAKTRLGTRLNTRYRSLLGEVVTRNYRKNEATSNYATLPNFTTSGSIIVEFDVYGPAQADNNTMSFRDNATLNSLGFGTGLVGNTSKFRVSSNTVPLVNSLTTMDVFDNVFHKVKFKYFVETANFIVLVDGVEGIPLTQLGYNFTETDVITLWRDATTGDNLQGIIANLKIYEDSVLVRDYPINDNSNTLKELVSGQDGAIINGTANQWGLFREFPSFWKGIDLNVPPWDSKRQELLKG
jgi:hypothetical protein